MPNWASIRFVLTGPEYEVRRFEQTCIRKQRGEDEISFDFEAIRPMPRAIAALDGVSEDAKLVAQRETGYEDWYAWNMQYREPNGMRRTSAS